MKREFQSGSGERGGRNPPRHSTHKALRLYASSVRHYLTARRSLAAALRRAFCSRCGGGRMTPNPSLFVSVNYEMQAHQTQAMRTS